MNFDLITNIQACYVEVPRLLYYSHVPAALFAFFLGVFVYLKNKNLSAKILFFTSIVFSLWVSLNLYLWLGHDSRVLLFSWYLLGILNPLLFASLFYFAYVFIFGKDIGFKYKGLRVRVWVNDEHSAV